VYVACKNLLLCLHVSMSWRMSFCIVLCRRSARVAKVRTGRSGVCTPLGKEIYSFSSKSRPVLGFTQPFSSVDTGFIPENERPERDVDHLPSSNSEVDNVTVLAVCVLVVWPQESCPDMQWKHFSV